ncbi:hypothetical protein HDU96_002998 [Phlyctochytrium bullatum]|nr:hypothetical protein HDU96_002998 [Phlyctochytrium bullatum]
MATPTSTSSTSSATTTLFNPQSSSSSSASASAIHTMPPPHHLLLLQRAALTPGTQLMVPGVAVPMNTLCPWRLGGGVGVDGSSSPPKRGAAKGKENMGSSPFAAPKPVASPRKPLCASPAAFSVPSHPASSVRRKKHNTPPQHGRRKEKHMRLIPDLKAAVAAMTARKKMEERYAATGGGGGAGRVAMRGLLTSSTKG